MAVAGYGMTKWKFTLMSFIDNIFFRIPFLSEFINQGLSKNFGIYKAWHLVSRAGIEGDYLEFGVYRGDTFRNSILASRNVFKSTPKKKFDGRFFAFDSFQGLPSAISEGKESEIYQKGEFSASVKHFEKNIHKSIRDEKVIIIPGWFSETCNDATQNQYKMGKAAFINIDCDLFQSTMEVLKFITPLVRTGTILYFDDWYSIFGSMNEGEAKACSEWLTKNPDIKLEPYITVGVTGKMFVAQVKAGSSC
jgi:O-methyltransferase